MSATNNCIFNDENNDTIGFYKDIKALLKEQAGEYLKENNWDMVQEMAGVLGELDEWAENKGLLVLSDNNGMGYTIKEYKGE